MSILADHEIKHLALKQDMIRPFIGNQVKVEDEKKVISYGLSSYGYDVRLNNNYCYLGSTKPWIIDPKDFNNQHIQKTEHSFFIIPPNSFVLARSFEYFKIPDNIMTICVGKSTYARCGIIVNVTPFEPGWEGFATLEISNTTPIPAKIYSYEGIAQVLFFRGNEKPLVTYEDKKGKYQNQKDIEYAKV